MRSCPLPLGSTIVVVYSCGTVRHEGETILPARTPTGYLRIAKGGGKEYVHRLVARAFLPNPNKLATVNHKDEDKSNNKVCNLEWMAQGDNARYSLNKAVCCRNADGFGYYFPSRRGANPYGFLHQNIVACLKGRQRTHRGFYWNELIPRLLCEEKGLQVLHHMCHDEKTKEEKALRKHYAQLKKQKD